MPGCRTRRPKRMRAAGPVGGARSRTRAPLCARAAREGMPAMAAMQVRSRRGGRVEGVGEGCEAVGERRARARRAPAQQARVGCARVLGAAAKQPKEKWWKAGPARVGVGASRRWRRRRRRWRRMDSPRHLLSPRATAAHAAALSRGHGPAVPRGVAALERGAARHFCEGVGGWGWGDGGCGGRCSGALTRLAHAWDAHPCSPAVACARGTRTISVLRRRTHGGEPRRLPARRAAPVRDGAAPCAAARRAYAPPRARADLRDAISPNPNPSPALARAAYHRRARARARGRSGAARARPGCAPRGRCARRG